MPTIVETGRLTLLATVDRCRIETGFQPAVASSTAFGSFTIALPGHGQPYDSPGDGLVKLSTVLYREQADVYGLLRRRRSRYQTAYTGPLRGAWTSAVVAT